LGDSAEAASEEEEQVATGKRKTFFLWLRIALIACFFFPRAHAQHFPEKITTLDGHVYESASAKIRKASVFVFLSPECPLCQGYTLTLNQLYSRFSPAGIEFYGVFPGTLYTTEEIKAFQKTYKLKFPLLLDPRGKVKDFAGASVTPEVFVYGPGFRLLYSGRIDNWAYAPGRHRRTVTEHDLENALSAIQKNSVILNKRTQPVGCIIE
jgi:peroxiredoxin